MSDHTPQFCSDQDYQDLLLLYRKAVNSLEGLPMSADKLECFTGLLVKIYFHAASIDTLTHGTVGSEHSFIDHSSINALSRSVFETYAQFYYLFFDTKDNDELEFRLHYYRYRGIKWRQGYKGTSPEAKDMKKRGAALCVELRKLLRKSEIYQKLSPDNQQLVLDGKYDKPTKTQLLKRALKAIPRAIIPDIYAFLSDVAHGGYIGVLQALQVDTFAQQKSLAESARSSIGNLLSMIVWDFTDQYPQVLIKLDADPEVRKIVHRLRKKDRA